MKWGSTLKSYTPKSWPALQPVALRLPHLLGVFCLFSLIFSLLSPLPPKSCFPTCLGILWASCSYIATQTVHSRSSWMQLTDGKTHFMLSPSGG